MADDTPHPSATISVIIPTHNREELVAEAVGSLIDSGWTPLEIIVVDDGSTDGTLAKLRAIETPDSVSLHIIEQEKQGQARARNAGLEGATGDFIYFLDSDDLVLPGAFAKLVEALEKTRAPYAVAEIAEANRAGEMLFDEGIGHSILDQKGIVGSRWAIHAALYSKGAIEAAGQFEEALALGEDKEFLWRIIANNAPGTTIGDVVALRRNHSLGQLSDGFSPLVMGRSSLSSLGAFLAWAWRERRMSRAIAQSATIPLAIATIRAGANGDSDARRKGAQLMRGLAADYPSVLRRILAWSLTNSPAIVLKMAMSGMQLARKSIHARRNARQRRHRTGSEDRFT